MQDTKIPASAQPIASIHLDDKLFYEDLRAKSTGMPAWDDLSTEQQAAVQGELSSVWSAFESAANKVEAQFAN